MKVKHLIITSFFLLILSSCESKKIEKYNFKAVVDSLIKTIKPNDTTLIKASLCKVFPNQWDSIAIIGPYSTPKSIESLNLKAFRSIKDEIISTTYDDSEYSLLFIKDGELTAYSIVDRSPIDLPSLKTSDSAEIYISNKNHCNDIYLKRKNQKFLSYDVIIK